MNITKQTGFSLIEAICVLAIASIIALVSIKSFAWLHQYRVSQAANQFAYLIRSAQQLALASGSTVHLCPVGADNTCDSTQSPTHWLIHPETDIPSLRATLDAGLQMDSRWPRWSVNRQGEFYTWGNIEFCSAGYGKKVVLISSGRTRTEDTSC